MKLLVCSTVAALAASLFASHALARHDESVRHEVKKSLRTGIADQRQRTWYWQDKAGVKRWPTRNLERRASLPYLYRLARLWKHRHFEARKHYRVSVASVGSASAWLCIHAGEGSWTAATGNGYYGGLQMDMSFQQAHGLDLLKQKGTANNWTPSEQMMVAQRAHDGLRTSDNGHGGVSFWHDSPRGYYPWPTTARNCGLI